MKKNNIVKARGPPAKELVSRKWKNPGEKTRTKKILAKKGGGSSLSNFDPGDCAWKNQQGRRAAFAIYQMKGVKEEEKGRENPWKVWRGRKSSGKAVKVRQGGATIQQRREGPLGILRKTEQQRKSVQDQIRNAQFRLIGQERRRGGLAQGGQRTFRKKKKKNTTPNTHTPSAGLP